MRLLHLNPVKNHSTAIHRQWFETLQTALSYSERSSCLLANVGPPTQRWTNLRLLPGYISLLTVGLHQLQFGANRAIVRLRGLIGPSVGTRMTRAARRSPVSELQLPASGYRPAAKARHAIFSMGATEGTRTLKLRIWDNHTQAVPKRKGGHTPVTRNFTL